ncbi:MAG: Fic family protein [Saprospiraceae bacterium]|nr:Fic family protein [Saprospiraceae bacterium]
MKLAIIKNDLIGTYLSQIPSGLSAAFHALNDAEISTQNFSFYTSVASVFSSKIEGEEIDLDSYIKHKRFGIEFSPDYSKKTDDLYSAYIYAKTNRLNGENIKNAHKLLSQNILPKRWQGKYRIQNMYVTTPDGKIEYVAASPFEVESEMTKYYADLSVLCMTQMTIEEIFFYASMLHLVFVKIHPWNDGNGRCARLIEKWFIADKIGEKAWFLQSEKYYYRHHTKYYENIRRLGLEYPFLDYSQSMPFLQMLPASLIT